MDCLFSVGKTSFFRVSGVYRGPSSPLLPAGFRLARTHDGSFDGRLSAGPPLILHGIHGTSLAMVQPILNRLSCYNQFLCKPYCRRRSSRFPSLEVPAGHDASALSISARRGFCLRQFLTFATVVGSFFADFPDTSLAVWQNDSPVYPKV